MTEALEDDAGAGEKMRSSPRIGKLASGGRLEGDGETRGGGGGERVIEVERR